MIRAGNLAKFVALLALGLILLAVLAGPDQLLGALGHATTPQAAPPATGDTQPLSVFMPGNDKSLAGMRVSPLDGVVFRFTRDAPNGKPGARELSAVLRAGRATPSSTGASTLTDAELRVFGNSQETPLIVIRSPNAKTVGFDAYSVASGDSSETPKDDVLRDVTLDLEDAHVVFHDDQGRMAPIALRTPRLRVEVRGKDIGSFETDDPITFEGDNLRGSGIGLKGYLAMGWFRVDRNVRLELIPGATTTWKDKVVLHSTGPADVVGVGKYSGRPAALNAAIALGAPALAFAVGKPVGTTTVTFYEAASFRADSPRGDRFVEVACDRLSMALANDGARSASLTPRSFEAEGNVVFSKERMTGRCAKAVGVFADASTLSDFVMDGPYLVELQLPESGGALPGVGAARTLVVEGPSSATGKLVDAATGTYSLRSGGKPHATFRGAPESERVSITAALLEARLSKEGITAFYADGDLVIDTARGTLRGETAELVEAGKHPALRVTGPNGATLAAHAPSKDGGEDRLELTARSILMRAAAANLTEIVAEGDAVGRIDGASRAPIVFAARHVETTIGDKAPGSVELDGKVAVQLPSRGEVLRGDHLVLEHELTEGVLRGAGATLERIENGVVASSVSAPEIRFTRDKTIVASGPVRIAFPAKLVTGRDEDASQTIVFHGSHLESSLDEKFKPTRAVLHGPVTSEGPLEVAGQELTLDFIARRHRLLAREGERTRVAGSSPRDGTRFRAEAPRFEFEEDTETIVMAGGGVIEFDGPRKKFDFFARRKSSGSGGTATMRFETQRDVRIDQRQAVFTGDANARLMVPDGWTLRGDSLTFDFDEKHEPAAVSASGHVRFDVPGEFTGSCSTLRYDERSGLLVVTGTGGAPAKLNVGKFGRFEGPSLSLNTRTYLIESGPGVISGTRTH